MTPSATIIWFVWTREIFFTIIAINPRYHAAYVIPTATGGAIFLWFGLVNSRTSDTWRTFCVYIFTDRTNIISILY